MLSLAPKLAPNAVVAVVGVLFGHRGELVFIHMPVATLAVCAGTTQKQFVSMQ